MHSIDETALRIRTEERGGMVRSWQHTLAVDPMSQETCRYSDVIAIDAGVWTGPVWLFAHLFYRYRQARWRSLLAATSEKEILAE